MTENREKLMELEKLADALAKDVISENLRKANSDPILVLYLSVAGMPASRVPILARSAAEGLRQAIPEARFVVVPTGSQETRLECINPRLAKPEEEPRILELIEKVDRDFQEFLKEVSLPKEETPQENRS